MHRLAQVVAEDIEPERVPFAHQHRGGVQGHPGRESEPPQVEAHADNQGERAVEDGEGPGRSTHQHRLGQGDVQRNLESFDLYFGIHVAPP